MKPTPVIVLTIGVFVVGTVSLVQGAIVQGVSLLVMGLAFLDVLIGFTKLKLFERGGTKGR